MNDILGDIIGVVIITALALVIVFFSFGLGDSCGYGRAIEHAIENGHAEYYLDKDHNRQWRWKEPTK